MLFFLFSADAFAPFMCWFSDVCARWLGKSHAHVSAYNDGLFEIFSRCLATAASTTVSSFFSVTDPFAGRYACLCTLTTVKEIPKDP